jgi:hypothetical protein
MAEEKTEGLELLNHSVERELEVHTYHIQDEEGVLVYKEWIQDGRVIDSNLESKDGETIWDQETIDRVQNFVDKKIQEGKINI